MKLASGATPSRNNVCCENSLISPYVHIYFLVKITHLNKMSNSTDEANAPATIGNEVCAKPALMVTIYG